MLIVPKLQRQKLLFNPFFAAYALHAKCKFDFEGCLGEGHCSYEGIVVHGKPFEVTKCTD